jgi:hypothetical protein
VPFVSGISALLIQNNRTGFEIKQILMDNAEDLGFDVNAQGAGLVKAYAAFTYNLTYSVSVENETTGAETGSIEVLPGEAVFCNFTVENLGESSDTFRIYAGGIPEEWINVPASVTMNAREIVNGRALITIPADLAIVENSSYNLTIYVIGKSRDWESVAVTVLASEQSKKNYLLTEVRNLKAEIELNINSSGNSNKPVNASANTTLIDPKFGREIIKKLDNAADSINKNDSVKAGEILTEISSDLNEARGGKLLYYFAGYLIAKIEDIRNKI